MLNCEVGNKFKQSLISRQEKTMVNDKGNYTNELGNLLAQNVERKLKIDVPEVNKAVSVLVQLLNVLQRREPINDGAVYAGDGPSHTFLFSLKGSWIVRHHGVDTIYKSFYDLVTSLERDAKDRAEYFLIPNPMRNVKTDYIPKGADGLEGYLQALLDAHYYLLKDSDIKFQFDGANWGLTDSFERVPLAELPIHVKTVCEEYIKKRTKA